jgi:predicted Zn-dependent protease
MIRSAGMSLLFSMLVGDLGATLVGQAAENLAGLKFSRDAESEADTEGFNLLVARGIEPRGMVRFFATLAAENGATPPALLSTHPASAEREAALAARLKALPDNCCQPLQVAGDWPPR